MEALREIAAVATSLVDSVPWPGAAVGLVVGDSLIWAAGFGVADRTTGEPVGTGTLFQIGSVTKSFTATLAGMAVERGRIAWSDPLASRLPPGTELPARPMTLGQIAAHRAGLPGDAPTLRRKHGDYPILAFTHFELYRSLAEAELQSEPGEGWAYSNFGYGVLGHVLELRSGLPYETLLTDELLVPLAMTSTTVTIWPELAGRLATPYIVDEATGVVHLGVGLGDVVALLVDHHEHADGEQEHEPPDDRERETSPGGGFDGRVVLQDALLLARSLCQRGTD